MDCPNTNATSITLQALGVNVEKGEGIRARGQGGQDGNSGSGKNRAAELLNSQQLWLHT